IPVTVPVLFLVQLNCAPDTFPDNAIVVIVLPEQMVCVAGVATALDVVLTTTVQVIGVPPQLFAVGVIVKVTVIGEAVVLVSVPLMFPLPLAAIPVTEAVLSLVQV